MQVAAAVMPDIPRVSRRDSNSNNIHSQNTLSTLYLRRMGRFSSVLERIAHTCDVDPTYLERALAIFAELTSASRRPVETSELVPSPSVESR